MLKRFPVALLSLLCASFSECQTQNAPRMLITSPVNEEVLRRLAGNTRPEVARAQDLGALPDDFAVAHLSLLLKRPAGQQTAFDQFVSDLSKPASSNFHHWLTPKQIGDRYGLAPQDITTIKNWLESNGFRINAVLPSGNLVDFSGTAGQVRAAFHTSMHRLRLNGEIHIANVSDPAIPAALAPAIEGITSLNDFHPHPLTTTNYPAPADTNGSGQYVAPGDLAVIYNLSRLYAADISGQGQTIAVLETSDLYDLDDWYAYRRIFGLTKTYPYGSISQVHPSIPGLSCDDPGVSIADREATLDSELATGTAPNASILVAACADGYEAGVFTALRNLLNLPDTPSIVSISYGQSETVTGRTENAFIYSLFEQAAAQGVSVFVCSQDWGGDGVYSDRGTPSLYGLSVSGFASTPFNVAVGGTDFEDTYLHENDSYWNASNAPNFTSAKSYVPEIPWDGSCADPLQAAYLGFATSYGADGLCNSPSVPANLLTGLVGSGGPSSCAYGVPAEYGIVSGSCAGYAKPSWQSVAGNPNDGVRDIPDVSLFASGGAWNHGYSICYSNPARAGSNCSQSFQIGGGTSASTPVMASIQALVNQSTSQSWGNPNPVYYALANQQYGQGGDALCNASLGNGISSACTFHDITVGTNDVICKPGTPNCYAPSGVIGVLSLSLDSYVPAYSATPGWDFATGIGSVNAFNLVSNWNQGVALSQSSQ